MGGRDSPRILVHTRRASVTTSLRREAARLAPRPRIEVRDPGAAVEPERSGDPALEIVDLAVSPAHLRALAQNREVGARRVALVDDPSWHALIDALAGGFDDYLLFPIRLGELRLLWRRHLEGDEPAGLPTEEAGGRRIRLEFPSDVRFCRSAVERVVEACGHLVPLGRDDAFRLRVALGEAVTNAVLYGNDEDPRRRVRVAAEADAGILEVRIADEGTGFDPEQVPDPTSPRNLERSHGRGLFLMRSLMDDVRFNAVGNEVTLSLRADPDRLGTEGEDGPLPVQSVETSEPADLSALLEKFERATRLRFRMIVHHGDAERVLHDSLADGGDQRPCAQLERPLPAGDRLRLVYRDPGADDATVVVPAASFLIDWTARLLRTDRELHLFSQEMVERYEEITLLTSISETLGSHIHVHAAAGVILRELSDVLGVRRASLWLEEEGDLQLFASHLTEARRGLPSDGASDASSADIGERALAAKVFESQEPLLLGATSGDADASGSAAAEGKGREKAEDARAAARPVLSVPVGYAPLEGTPRRIGVLNLIGRTGGSPFRAGDLRLMTAVASQIGAAIQNGRLVEESLRRERVMAELEIAHDLQLKMLPKLEGFSDLAEVAARCEPAESIGGDFYLLIRLPGRRLGVMLGDVSSHGISAALIMALTMSAASIYARERERPGDVLLRIHRQLLRELESTEMYMTLFYGVMEPEGRELRYANAGHPFAYRLRPGGARRLEALDPPLGVARPRQFGEARVDWRTGEDYLFLFTDGLVEGPASPPEEALVRAASRASLGGAAAVVESLFRRASSDDPDDRTALVVRI